MKIHPRIFIPIVSAILCAMLLIAVLWWQLATSTALLLKQNKSSTLVGNILQNTFPSPPDIDPAHFPENAYDESLLQLRRGDLLALNGELAQAQQEYEQSIRNGGGLPALRKLAQIQLQRRDMRGAKETLRQLKNAGARSEDLLLLESIILLRSGELVQARSLLQHAPDSPQKYYGLSLLAILEGDHQKAKEHLEYVRSGWEPILRSFAITILAAYGEYDLFPTSPNIHLITLLARSLAQVQECELALPLLVQVTQEQDDYRDAWIVQGYCEFTTERFNQSLHSFERAYTLDPEKPEIQYFLGRSYAALGNHSTALTFLQYALKNGFEPQGEVRKFIIQEAIATDNATIAIDQYDALLSLPSATIAVFREMIHLAIASDNQELALLKAIDATHRFPEDPQAFLLLGEIALQTNNPDQARTALSQALSLDPNLSVAKDLLKKL
ncbi:tetratricopeptide repeat protein [Candidatus Peregrinibacteria bacterium]|nr:tetratricopeptide repeat protein [Candidatus Peregrinibacteria bacterium]